MQTRKLQLERERKLPKRRWFVSLSLGVTQNKDAKRSEENKREAWKRGNRNKRETRKGEKGIKERRGKGETENREPREQWKGSRIGSLATI